ncbi:MAG: DNA replication terminus site-binding protein [Endozoicomonadaceae bacterium]|nr:DNA replication terminus site-binding protein [Endozoicomonadaceae bacterium]
MPKVQIINSMNNIKDAEMAFKDIIHSATILQSKAFILPPPVKDEKQVGDFASQIPVEVISGEKAFFHALNVWSKYTADDGYSTRFSKAEPAIILIRESGEARSIIIEKIEAFNTAKDSFIKAAAHIKNKDLRFQIIHDLYPMLMMNNLRRNIQYFEDPQTAYFGWSNKPLIYKKNKTDLIKALNKSRDRHHPMFGDNDDAWRILVEKEIAQISRLDDNAILRQIRAVPTQPLINVDRVAYACPMPVIAFVADSEPLMKDLNDYDIDKRVKRGQVPTEKILINERLGIYQVRA